MVLVRAQSADSKGAAPLGGACLDHASRLGIRYRTCVDHIPRVLLLVDAVATGARWSRSPLGGEHLRLGLRDPAVGKRAPVAASSASPRADVSRPSSTARDCLDGVTGRPCVQTDTRACLELCGQRLQLMSDNGWPFVICVPSVLTRLPSAWTNCTSTICAPRSARRGRTAES